MTTRWWLAIATLLIAGRVICGGDEPTRLRVVTFNIEDFPKHQRQIEGAFAELAALKPDVVALQELVDPALFEREARARLGSDWGFVSASTEPLGAIGHPVHHLGLLYDRRTLKLVSVRLRDETRLEGRHKPTLQVRLELEDRIVSVFVVHLKAGGDMAAIRARQIAALASVVQGSLHDGDSVVLLGDFNATSDADRDEIAALAAATGLRWTTRDLACSAFWNRDDGCPRSRLDHVLSRQEADRVDAAGACATEGCDRQDRCPIYRDEVSDHCPVFADFTYR
ncbi:MAG: endonuclease/exonuclease/phosphatase family protein [Kofleriaceae bacterium]